MEKIVIIDDETEIFSVKTEISKGLNSLNREIDLYYSRPEDNAEIISRIKDSHTVVVTKATTKIDNDIIENSPSLKHIAVFGTALDHIDVNAAKRNGIVTTSIPNSFTMSVAEHTIAMIFSLIKKIPQINDRIKNNNEWPSIEVDLINGKTMGIIGSGMIGEQVAKLTASLGMHVIMTPVIRVGNERIRTIEEFAEVADINMLLENSDVISIHTKLTPETRHLIDIEEFSKIKRNAIIINTARGSLINQSVLYDALITGKIAGAALDVFEKEPIEETNPLKTLENVILTSHNGANSKELIYKSIVALLENVKQNL